MRFRLGPRYGHLVHGAGCACHGGAAQALLSRIDAGLSRRSVLKGVAAALATPAGISPGVEPVIGARAFLAVSDKVSLQAQADIGGFGVGSGFAWQVLATANHVVNEHYSVWPVTKFSPSTTTMTAMSSTRPCRGRCRA
jgi:hypothetical protein